MSADMFFLAAIGERIRTQDNRATALPIYVVQQKKRTYGFDPDYDDDGSRTVWLDCESNEADAEERKPLDEAWHLCNDIPDGWSRTAYQDTWEYVTYGITEAGRSFLRGEGGA